ncbi:ATP-dependent helicase HepA [Haloferula luteola]|uniref:ATP-dependent helicase HepA n=1 Tax=Haloferula luteola TaxID=595692 RepID=A0A840V534_9BACT|nr:helicase-related protein [Haloferula luteola]MBB5353082.1 ATP-dependent helicase HepA [Haloferula luteola]
MQLPRPGQRWVSTSEPALGLGIVLTAGDGRVELHFPAAEETRLYALDSAPVVRVHFKTGDSVADHEGREFRITGVREESGRLVYLDGDTEVPEAALLDTLSFTAPEERLLAGMCDEPGEFDLRRRVLDMASKLRRSPARGFLGARIDLIPHQFAIVAEACRRPHPRLLLADEVGLGKTIEACLILQHLHLTGRAERVLILVPEPLLHQWFVELLRRFNLLFALFDQERCEAILANDPEANPFLDSQLVLAPIGWLAEDDDWRNQAANAGFDLLIVDEAHHLEWSPGESSPAYAAVEALGACIASLLLLTATPTQLGPEGHFARLRLLDPARYGDLSAFLAEAEGYEALVEEIAALPDGAPEAREKIDRFGTGRVLFRNTRRKLQGFPVRRPLLHPLSAESSPYTWLADLLRLLPEEEKVLLITSSPEAAESVREKLLQEMEVECTIFTEDLTLLQRDRNAAWFADPEGARLLICSEIGSEGRNFQFARHLVLFGLPRDPELLEQRIGRLDRIGQTGDIHIHVPYGEGSASERHARWLHEGVDAFSQPLRGASTLAAEFLPELEALTDEDAARFKKLLRRSRQRSQEIAHQLDSGHDRLLELAAPPASDASALIEHIEAHDNDPAFERFIVRLFDRLGLDVSDLFVRAYHFARGQRLSEAFADLPEEGLSATFDRDTALAREDLALLTADHPMVRGAVEHFLGSELGNAAFARWEGGRGKGILLEACFVLEVPAPGRLHLDRFLPPTAIRVMTDHTGKDLSDKAAPGPLAGGQARKLVTQPAFRDRVLPTLLDRARELATARREAPVAEARKAAEAEFTGEIARLRDLATRNPQVRPDEITTLEALRGETLEHLDQPRLRLDSLRVIWCS